MSILPKLFMKSLRGTKKYEICDIVSEIIFLIKTIINTLNFLKLNLFDKLICFVFSKLFTLFTVTLKASPQHRAG